MSIDLPDRSVPPRALVLSLAALVVPVIAALVVPSRLADYGALLWLLSLVPAFLLAYYRGWKGVATALAAGMATLSMTQAAATWMHRTPPSLLLGVVVAYLAISLAVGWLAEALHRDRAIVEDMAFTDLLTHLPNRRHARLFLENEFAAAERGRLLSVVLFDLDHFKGYNDKWGHAGGDEALAAFANILAPSTRRMDLSARFGGEEFLAVLTSTDTEGALTFADRIRESLANTTLSTGDHLTVSAGIATFHPSLRSPDKLLAAADHALYQAKHQGRNRVCSFTDTMMKDALPLPSENAARGLLETIGEVSDYPRANEDIGRTRPPLTLLPQQITGFDEGRRAPVVEDDEQGRPRESILRAVRSLVEAVELRDVCGRGHGTRVASYAERIAAVLDPGGRAIHRPSLRLGCEVHDVGKIGVPLTLFEKEGALDETELDRLREHPALGHRILEPLLADERVLAVALWHHERWDGTGYPDGLSGDAIPIEARLAAVCNTLDAHLSDGRQTAQRTWDEAVAEIRSGSGTRFDPRVVAAMDACLEELRAIYEGTPPEATAEVG